jgi:hypothetical protein
MRWENYLQRLMQHIASLVNLLPALLLSFIFSKEYMEEYVEEFEQRLDQTSPTPFRLIRKIISADLKRPINRIFDNIQQYLLASTSIAQVHAVILVTIAKYEPRG